ncbi:hypothetical protein KSP40_PGU012640 [Platanthera guangdongensis]|uniref:Uncharacterized protein n=1 Tax=Platanthera guangdongensis TaxID=2320717 RepID=A0ABR2MJQ1_9ASPA
MNRCRRGCWRRWNRRNQMKQKMGRRAMESAESSGIAGWTPTGGGGGTNCWIGTGAGSRTRVRWQNWTRGKEENVGPRWALERNTQLSALAWIRRIEWGNWRWSEDFDPNERYVEEDYYNSRKFAPRRGVEDDFEAEAEAEKRILNAKRANLQKSTLRKPVQSAARSTRHPVEEYSESEREESEYETEGEDVDTSPAARDKELDDKDEYEEDADEEAVGTISASEEEEPRRNARETGGSSLKRKEIESDVDSPPRKAPTHRRKAVVFDSDDD